MGLSFLARAVLRLTTMVGLAFLYVPLLVIVILSFNKGMSLAWPPQGFSTQWWEQASHATGPQLAMWASMKVALVATAIAIVLGSLAAFAIHRYRFFGRSTISFLLILPIALPGIVTAVALQSAFHRMGLRFGYLTVIIAHATFCIVVAFNNVIARVRRMQPNLAEASADLGADGWQTFRYVTFPLVRSAILAGGLLAFALSFDEIVVTSFTAGPGLQTLPQWIFENINNRHSIPIVNVVATAVMVFSIPLAWLAQRLADSEG